MPEKIESNVERDRLEEEEESFGLPTNRREARVRVMQLLYAGSIGERVGEVDIDQLSRQLFDGDAKKSGDLLEFALDLLRKSWNKRGECDDLIRVLAENWDFERIAPVDKAILRMGLAEILYCEEIPPRVSINEAIEISKDYSTDKSGVFINGMLDAAVTKLKKENRFQKSGRGLIGES